MNSKKYEIMLSVITILTVILTATGVSFAYFTTRMTGENGEINATTGTIGSIQFDGGADFQTSTNIEPGWSESKTFTITAAPSLVPQTIEVRMKYTNGFRDITANVSGDGAIGDFKPIINETVEQDIVLVTKTFSASEETQVATYTLTMGLPDNDANQNYDQGKLLDGTLYAKLKEEVYYTNAHPEGTLERPTLE